MSGSVLQTEQLTIEAFKPITGMGPKGTKKPYIEGEMPDKD